MSGMSTLESRYRRLLMLLPSAYRERRAEEMLGVLLDGAAEGRRWPRAVEVASLAGLAVRLRTGAPGGSLRASAFGELLQQVALTGLLIQALYFGSLLGQIVMGLGQGTLVYTQWFWLNMLLIVLVGFEMALPAAALVCLVRGSRRAGRVLAALSLAAVCAEVAVSVYLDGPIAFMLPWAILLPTVAPLLTSLLGTAAAMIGFHRDAPAPAAPGRWLKILTVSLLLVLICAVYTQVLDGTWGNSGDKVGAVGHLIVSPIAPAVAVLSGISSARRSVIRSTGLLILSVPVVALSVPVVILLLDHMSLLDQPLDSALLGRDLPELTWQAVITQLILAVACACWAAVRRRHGGLPASAGPGLAGSA